MKTKNIIFIIAIVAIVLVIGYLIYGYYAKLSENIQNPIATIEVEGFGKMVIELYPDQAPNTVANFIKLANEGHYNGLTFHRIISDFMIQGGDKNGDGTGSLEYNIPGEFLANGYKNNTLSHKKGVISMARSDYTQGSPTLKDESYNSASAQFFIMTEDNSSLNGIYAAFGKMTEGYDVLEKLANVEIEVPAEGEQSTDRPVNLPVMTSVTVETFGVEYGEPKTVEPFDYNSWLMNRYGTSAE